MRLVPSDTAAWLAWVVATAAAQQITAASVPACAEPALLSAVQASGCSLSDVKCICANPKLTTGFMTAIETACDPADQAAVEAFAQTYCGAGVVSSAAAASTEASISATTAASMASTTLAASTTSLPTEITQTATTSVTEAISTDTSVLVTSATFTGTTTTVGNYSSSMTYSTTKTHAASATTKPGFSGASTIHMSIGALVVAIAMGLAFSEL